MSGRQATVGFGDMVRFGVGAAVPALILVSALIIAAFVVTGADVDSGITVAFTAAFVLAVALELFRRAVLASHGDGAVRLFRFFLRIIVVGAVPVTLLVGAGVLVPCYRQACQPIGRFMLQFMFACCLCTLPMVPLGYSLLRRAAWLAPSPQPNR